MVSKFQFLLDGGYVDDPKGWEDLDTTIKRDQTIYGLLITQESQLEFYGTGYTYIKNLFDTQGFCDYIEIEIRQTCDQLNYDTIFKGVIYLSDCLFDIEKCSVKVKTVDDGYYARINNNKSIKAFLNVGRSKNDIAITAAAATTVEFFVPSTGAYLTGLYDPKPNVYKAYEVFRFLIAFMTDGFVEFASTIFGTGGTWEGVCITIGNEIRLADQSVIPEVSFEEVFTELNKKLRIGFSIEKINGRPTMRIEEFDYFYGQSSALTLPNAKSVTMQMDTTQLYSKVHLGSDITDDSLLLQFPEDVRFVGFKDEEYHIIGTCNIDKTLELNSQWVISSNVIEDVFVNQVPDYDEDIFLVDIDVSTNQATQSNWITGAPPPYFYNELFTNEKTVERWLGGIPNSIAIYLGNADNSFAALRTADSATMTATGLGTTVSPVQFDDDYTPPYNDVNNRYGNGTTQGNPVSQADSRYTAVNSGAYTFETNIDVFVVGYAEFLIRILRYDAGNVFTGISIVGGGSNITGAATMTVNGTINMVATDYAIVEVFFSKSQSNIPTTVVIKGGSTFECLAVSDGGGIYQQVDPADYKIKKFSFKYPITYDEINTIKADTKKLITFTTNNGVQQTGWIDTIKYYHHDKAAELILISN